MKYFKLRMITIIILTLVVLSVLGAAAYSQHAVFGKLPDAERQIRLEGSSNFVDGLFHNQIDTPLLTTDDSQISILLSNFLNKGQTHPPTALPSFKTDLKALDATQDLVIWLGHSSYYVQLGGQRVLIDPVFSSNASPIPSTNVAFAGTSLYTAEDMPEINLLLITHDHYDHLDYPSIKELQSKVAKVVTGLGVGAHFAHWGYDMQTVQEADWHDSIELTPALQLIVTPARHFSGRTFTKDKSLWVGFALLSPERRLFFSGDSGYAPHFAKIGQQHGPFDWVTLDTGQYDPRWANVHMNPEQAAQAADDLRARAFSPGHVGRFSISPHDWDDPFKRIVAASLDRSYALWTPEIGQAMHLDGRDQVFTLWWEGIE